VPSGAKPGGAVLTGAVLTGAVLVDKPAGPTSHDVVAWARRALGTRAVGHTGTLDPFATGLLIVLAGRATRLARFVEGRPKTYLATARLGVRTTTDDRTGDAVGEPVDASAVPEASVREALAGFAGTAPQRPPSFSAKHVAGERSYRLARRGEAVALAEVEVTVHRIELVAYEPPEVTFRATVSAGTYLRAIARDLGERLGVGAHLTALRREAIGDLGVETALSLDRFEQLGAAALVPVREVLRHLPAVELDEAERKAVSHGRRVVREAGAFAEGAGHVALVAGGEIVAVAAPRDGALQPVVVLEGQG
jgi:tRNA pseudouridine55 synthase